MFTKNNKLHSEAYKYLKHKTKNIIGFSFNSTNISESDYEEKDLVIDDNIELVDKTIKFKSVPLLFIIDEIDYASIKTTIIKKRYSDDDQMALILNKDNSNEDLEYYNKMQEWRNFAADIARKVVNLS